MSVRHCLEGLKPARLRAGLTRQEVADAAGVTITSYDRFESGVRRCYFDRVCVIADLLGVTTEELRRHPDDSTVVAANELATWDLEGASH